MNRLVSPDTFPREKDPLRLMTVEVVGIDMGPWPPQERNLKLHA